MINYESVALVPLTQGFFAVIDRKNIYLIEPYRWCVSKQKGGKVRGCEAHIGGKKILMHRHILGLELSDGKEVDHINGDSLDCRENNLRIVTHSQNCLNTISKSKYGYKRITLRADGYYARLFIGPFDTPEEAARVYDEGQRQNYREYYRPNFLTKEEEEKFELVDRECVSLVLDRPRHKKEKLAFSEAKKIRELYSSGKYSQKELAQKYGVVSQTISKIINNERWKK